MAVKPEKIKERLKALFPKANLSQKRIDEISAKLAKKPADDADDEAVDVVINDANDLMDFAAIAKEDDRIRTLEAKAKQPDNSNPNPAEPKKDDKDDEVPSWAKTLLQKVEGLEKGEIIKSKQSTVAELFSKSEVLKSLPEAKKQSWMNRVNLESEDLSAEITALEEEYTEIKQSIVNSSDFAGSPNHESTGGNNISDADINAVMNQL